MFKKENVQFYVGAAVGVTVGLCVGKLLSPNTSDIRNNKLHSNISDVANVGAFVRRPTDDISNDDNVPIDTHKSRYSSFTSRYRDKNFEDSTILMAPLTKPASCESKININNVTPIKQMKLNNMPLNHGSYQITHKEKDLTQDAYFLKKSHGRNVKEEITIFDNFDSVVSSSSDSNMATCNTLLDEEQVNSTSTPNESLDVKQYDEFSKSNLLSSTTYDVSISF